MSQYTCACPTGIKLNPDGKTCPKSESVWGEGGREGGRDGRGVGRGAGGINSSGRISQQLGDPFTLPGIWRENGAIE